MKTMTLKALAILLVLCGLLDSRPARADEDGLEMAVALWITGEVVSWGLGLVGLVGNSYALQRPERPHGAWVGIGFAGMGLNAGIAVPELVFGSSSHLFLGLGIGHVAMAALDTGLSIATTAKRSRYPEPAAADPAALVPVPPPLPAAREIQSVPVSAEPPSATPAPPQAPAPSTVAPEPAPAPKAAPRPAAPQDEPGISSRLHPVAPGPRIEIVPLLGPQGRGVVAGLGIRIASW